MVQCNEGAEELFKCVLWLVEEGGLEWGFVFIRLLSDRVMENGENRAEKVKQAVQFLADSRVAAAPLERAVGFLQRKGLTAGEIREALNKSTKTITPEIEKLIDNPEKATTATTPAQSASPQVAQQVIPGQAPVQTLPPGTTVPMYAYAPSPTIVQPPSTRSKWKEAILWVGALSAIGLVLRELLRKYIVPIYFPEEVEGKRLKDVQTEVSEKPFLTFSRGVKEKHDGDR